MEQQRNLFFDLGQGQLGRGLVGVVDVPVFHPIHPGRKPCLEKGPVLRFFEGDDEVRALEIEVQYLQREAPGSGLLNASRSEAGKGMGRDGAGIVQS